MGLQSLLQIPRRPRIQPLIRTSQNVYISFTHQLTFRAGLSPFRPGLTNLGKHIPDGLPPRAGRRGDAEASNRSATSPEKLL